MMLSDCCDAHPWGEIEHGICSDCKDHCGFYDDQAGEIDTPAQSANAAAAEEAAFQAWLEEMEQRRAQETRWMEEERWQEEQEEARE